MPTTDSSSHISYSWQTGFSTGGPNSFALSRPDRFEHRWCCPGNLGAGTFRRIEIRSGFDIWITDCVFKRDALFACHDTPAILIFAFHLSGEQHTTIGRQQTKLELCAEQQYIFYLNEPNGIGRVKTGIPTRHVSVTISPERLLAYYENDMALVPPMLQNIIAPKSTDDFRHAQHMTPGVHAAIHQIMCCPFRGTSRKLFLESRALELIARQLDQLAVAPTSPSTAGSMHPDDRQRTDYAKSLLLSNIASPPTLFELSRAAGMSHPKLNRCFRQMYGMTVFQYLRKERLDQAREMLEQHGRTVTETAYSVGYDSISHFSQAYKKHFGMPPSTFARTI